MKMPLAMLPQNKEAVIVEVKGGKRLTSRLLELGFTPGAKVKVLSNSGPAVVDVRGSRIALGWGVLSRIIVSVDERGDCQSVGI